ncbi:MAG TPA: hypothetical protein VM307_06015 [Egibacteraceae bacterium]|nr:hypothetical protein [Egibacteraceae bacterium]
MRRANLLAVLALLLGSLSAVPAAADGRVEVVELGLGAGGIMSDNVEYIGTIPVESPGIGGRVLEVDGQQRFYMTGAKGLTILDVTNPASPVTLGRLPLPHFQNEDVDVSDDGKRVIISTDTAAARLPGYPGFGSTGNGIHIIDTSDVTAPKAVGFIALSNHTTTCADAACEWLYGSSGHIVDATDPAAPKDTGKKWFRNGVTGSHALNRDASGLMISDSTPRLVLDVSDPTNPVALAEGRPDTRKFGQDGLLQHNNVRPDADQWVPREEGDTDPLMRAGELMIGNSESNINRNCNQAGGLSTWNMTDFDKGRPMQQIDVFRPFNGNWVDGNPAANALGCSGHWFTVDGEMVTTSWYEHGVRFFHVDRETGKITQKGFFQPIATQAGAAHWITDAEGNKYVYSADYARGLDILKFNPDAPEPTAEEFKQSWLINLGKVGAQAEAERLLCRLSQT